jgi:hypothetical protein
LPRNIKIAPAKALELATDDINKRLNLKQKYPLSTAADDDIKRLQKVLSKARDAYKSSYEDFEKVYSNVVSPATLKGLGTTRIKEILTSPSLRKAYELQLTVDPKFKLVEGVTVEDIMGKEMLSALNPVTAGLLDATSEFTKANLETAGIKPRDLARAYSGDIVTVLDGVAEKYNMAGNQAIVKLKETSDGVFKWVVEYFNTKTLDVEERAFSDIEPLVDNIFPVRKIQEDLSYRMEALNTFIAGAAAGLVGITPKDFKKQFDLGERFFSEIPTTTLLQGGFGFTPGSGYGPVPGAEKFTKDIQEFYFKPMDELQTRTSQLEKLRLEGIESGDTNISKDMYDSINNLLTILKNNQVVLQFRAVLVDLMKEFSESERILKQNIGIMKQRNKVDKETAGLMAGVSKGLEDYDIGIQKVGDLTPRQSLLRSSAPARALASELKVLRMTSDNQLSQLDGIQTALTNMDDVRAVARATGAALDQSNLGNFVEKVAKQSGEDGPYRELTKINTKVADNTADTVDRLDKLLENQGDPETLERMLSSFSDNLKLGAFSKPLKIANAMERVAEIRKKAEKSGNQEAVIASNKVLDQLVKKMVNLKGLTKGAEFIDMNPQLFKRDFTSAEFKQRAFSGIDPEAFLRKMEELGPKKESSLFKLNEKYVPFWPTKRNRESFADSDELSKIRKLQEGDGKQTLISGRTLAKVQASIAAASYLEKRGAGNVVKVLDTKLKETNDRIEDLSQRLGPNGDKIERLMKERDSIAAERNKVQKDVDFYGMVTAMSTTGAAASELGMAFGLTEGQVKALNVAAIGTYAAMKLASEVVGKELPDSAKEFGRDLKEVAKKVVKGEDIGYKDSTALGKSGKRMMEDLSNQSKKIFGKGFKDLTKEVESEKAASSAGKRARRGAEFTEGPSRIKQLLAAYLAASAADYAARKSSERTGLSTTESRMQEQQEAMLQALNKYPDVAEKVLTDIYAKSEAAAASGEPSDVETVTKSLVQDTEGEYRKVAEMIEGYNKQILKSHEETARKMADIQRELADKELREAEKIASERAIFAERDRRRSQELSRKYSFSNIIQGGLAGYSGDFELPVTKEELSTQQRIYSESRDKFKSLMKIYADGPAVLDSIRSRMEEVMASMSEEEAFIRESGDEKAIEVSKKRFSDLAKELKKLGDVADKQSANFRKLAEAFVPLQRFSEAIDNLQRSLKEVAIQEAVENIPGMIDARRRSSMLLGGGHPNALQMVTPAEQRSAARVGIELEAFSPKFEIERAQLEKQRREATGTQRTELNRQLAELDVTQGRRILEQNQLKDNDRLEKSLAPFYEQVPELERLINLPNQDDELLGELIRYRDAVTEALKNAYKPLSLNQYRQELEAAKPTMRPGRYEQELRGLEYVKREKGENAKVFRGIGIVQDQLSELTPKSIQGTMKERAMSAGKGLDRRIADPIVEEVAKGNNTLVSIAETLFNIDFEKLNESLSKNSLVSDTVSGKLASAIGDRFKSVFSNLFKSSSKGSDKYALGGPIDGAIAGPGGPTSDMIPAMLSDGEYVIKTASAKRLGYDRLSYMNETGNLPGFAAGGKVAGGIFSGIADQTNSVLNYLQELRLKSVNSTVGNIEDLMSDKKLSDKLVAGSNLVTGSILQGGLAAAEILGNITKMPIDTLAGMEKTIKYINNNSIKEMYAQGKTLGSNLASYAKERGTKGVLKDVFNVVKDPIIEDLKVGGTALTANALIGAPFKNLFKLTKNIKSGKILASHKNPYDALIDADDTLTWDLPSSKKPLKQLNQRNYIKDFISHYNDVADNNNKFKNLALDVPENLDHDEYEKLVTAVDILSDYTNRAPEAKFLGGVYAGSGGRGMLKAASLSKGFDVAGFYKYHNKQLPNKAIVGLNIDNNVSKKSLGKTVLHEVGHHFDRETQMLAKFLQEKPNFASKYKGSREFLTLRKNLDAAITEDLKAQNYPSLYSMQTAENSAGRVAKREFLAELAAGRGKGINSLSSYNAFRRATINNKDVNSMMTDLFDTPDYLKYRDEPGHLFFNKGGKVDKDELGRPIHYYTAYGDDIQKHINREDFESARKELANKIESGAGVPSEDYKKYTSEEARENMKKFYDSTQSFLSESAPKAIKNFVELWAPQTLMESQDSILRNRREKGRIKDPETFAGYGAQYNTEQRKRALAKQSRFASEQVERRARKETKYALNRINHEDKPGVDLQKLKSVSKTKQTKDSFYDSESFGPLSGHQAKLKMTLHEIKEALKRDLTEEERGALNQHKTAILAVKRRLDSGYDPMSEDMQVRMAAAINGAYFDGRDNASLTFRGNKFTSMGTEGLLGISSNRKSKETTVGVVPKIPFSKAPPTRVTKKSSDDIVGSLMETILNKETPLEQIINLLKPSNLFSAFLSNRNQGSSEPRHTGGYIPTTGTYFLQRGEEVVPKLANGGIVGLAKGGDPGKVGSFFGLGFGSINFDALANKIKETIEGSTIKIEDKEVRLAQNTVIAKLEKDSLPVEKPSWKVEVEQPKPITVEVAQPQPIMVEVARPSWEIGVAMPEEKIQVDLDVDSVAGTLKRAIKDSLETTVKVQVESMGGVNAVGSDSLNEIAQAVAAVNDRIFKVQDNLDRKIEILTTRLEENNETSDISRAVASAVDARMIPVQQDLNNMRTTVGAVDSTLRQNRVYMDARLTEQDRRINETQNVTGIGPGRLV